MDLFHIIFRRSPIAFLCNVFGKRAGHVTKPARLPNTLYVPEASSTHVSIVLPSLRMVALRLPLLKFIIIHNMTPRKILTM